MRKFLKVLCGCMVGILLWNSGNVFAMAESNNSFKIETLNVSEDAMQYAKNIIGTLLDSVVVNPELFQVDINNIGNWKLGSPYTIFSADNNNIKESHIYYFPILNNQNIELILSIYKVDNDWNAALSKDIAESLNDLKLNQECNSNYILYSTDNKIIAEYKNGAKILKDYDNTNVNESGFFKESFDNKQKLIENRFGSANLRSVNITDIESADFKC